MFATRLLHFAQSSLLSRASLRASPVATQALFHFTPRCLWQFSASATSLTLANHHVSSSRLLSRTMIIPSAQSAIRDDLAGMPTGHKWGWVIYRCTYTDESVWARFRARVEKRSRESIEKSDAPEIAARLEWHWVDDRALDGVSTAALRERFRAWSAEQVARQPGNYDPPVIPRFRYFVKIDQEVLDSLADSLSSDKRWLNGAFVKFVDGQWEPTAEDQNPNNEEWEEEKLEPIDGCTGEHVGWMRIAPHMINADFYDALSGDENLWDVFYERPPSIVFY